MLILPDELVDDADDDGMGCPRGFLNGLPLALILWAVLAIIGTLLVWGVQAIATRLT